MDEIAAAAGISRPTLYRYFKDRETLIVSIVENRAKNLIGRVHRLLGESDSLEEQLVSGTLFIVDVGRRDEFIRELLHSEKGYSTSDLMVGMTTAVDFTEAVWAPTLTRAADQGVLPEGFDEKVAYEWLTNVHFMLVGWQDYDEKPLSYRRQMLRGFLVPAFLRS
jgi:AcrR family transcriptional regulator